MTARFVATIALLCSLRTAHAGPYCGATLGVAPAEDVTLPVAPTVAVSVEDSYYGGTRQEKASASAIRATIDGKRVSIAIRDVRSVDGVIRFLKIQSRKTGKLEIWARDRWTTGDYLAATYTIAKDWTAPDRPTVSVHRDRDRRLGPYHYVGELAVLRVDVPAIAFTLRWRRDHEDSWRVRPLPAAVATGHSEARIGQTMCGMVENVPLAFLEKGIEVELTAILPDGRSLAITEGLPSPLVIPPLPADAPTTKGR